MAKFIDLTGQRFGYLTVESKAGIDKKRGTLWNCVCDCGNTKVIETRRLRNNVTRSCGCKSAEMRSQKRYNPQINTKCAYCGREYHLKPYLVKRCEHNYCSRACFAKAKQIYMQGEGNHQYGLHGPLNASYKGVDHITRYGYRQIQQWDHPFATGAGRYVLEHRLVAERYLLTDENSVVINGQRYLSPDYVVHHINGDKLDNRVENLQVMTLAEHTSLHNYQRIDNMIRNDKGQFVSQKILKELKKDEEI